MKKLLSFTLIIFLATSCISTKSTIKNVDDNAPIPKISSQNTFVLTQFATDKKYGYDPDYPVNVFYRTTKDGTANQKRFLDALAGPKGETISYSKLETCCPFPTKRNEMGAGFLDVYEIKWNGQKEPVKLYFNIYEKGALMVPVGFNLKKE